MKGVSPVIATVLMVAVAIAAAVVFYSWIMSTTASTTTQASAKAGEIGKYSLRVEAAECNTDANMLTVYIRNDSDVDFNETMTYSVVESSGRTVTTGTTPIYVPANTVKEFNIVDNALHGEADKRITFVLRAGTVSISPSSPITCT